MQKPKSKRKATRKPKVATNPLAPVGALKVPDACSYLGGISKLSLYKLCERGMIRPSRGLRHLLFPVSELDRYLKDTMCG